jgi:hypothetical protein
VGFLKSTTRDANDLTPEDKDVLARALHDPVVRKALDVLGPMDLQRTLRMVRDLERVRQERQREIRILRKLREALSQPSVLDRLRARRAAPTARYLLLVAYRLGLGDGPR